MERNFAARGYRLAEREAPILHRADPSLPKNRFDYSIDEIDVLLPAAALALDGVLAQQAARIRSGKAVHDYLITDEILLRDTITMLSEDALALAEAAQFAGDPN